MVDIYNKYCHRTKQAHFLTVYIEEAHAKDEWDLPDSADADLINIYSHRSIADRLAAAKEFVRMKNFPCEVVCDSAENEGIEKFDAWPERLYIIVDGVVAYKGGYGPNDYMLGEVCDWLETHTSVKCT